MGIQSKIRSIALADDDEDDREIFKEALDSLSLPVSFATYANGKDLVEGLKADNIPDIVFLDLNMPLLSGLESLTEIRRVERFKDVPIIAIYSTSSASEDKFRSFEGGADAYICKPISFEGLRNVLNKVLAIDWSSRGKDMESFVIQ